MKKVVFIPLDERPCNAYYPKLLTKDSRIINLVLPPREILGDKKTPANLKLLSSFIKSECIDASILVVSLDTLLYGGIVPSRLHHYNTSELLSRLELLKEIKELNKDITIYAFGLIMRCPAYSSSEEEPDYYEYDGFNINRIGYYKDLSSKRDLTKDEEENYNHFKQIVNLDNLKDFETRRNTNYQVLLTSLSYLKSKVIDFFIIPLDDSQEYGYSRHDQEVLRKYIKDEELDKYTYIYPSADDTGLTMLARCFNCFNESSVKIYVDYLTPSGSLVIPRYECLPLDETITYQIGASGSTRVFNIEDSDVVLMVNVDDKMLEIHQEDVVISREKYLLYDSFIDRMTDYINQGESVAIADVRYPNRSDDYLIDKLINNNLLYKVSSYAGWNTSSNTLGTTICQSVIKFYENDTLRNNTFLSLRYLEDYGYMSIVRSKVLLEYASLYNFEYFNANEDTRRLIELELKALLNTTLIEVNKHIKKLEVYLPWRRMFEVGLLIEGKDCEENNNN